MVSVPWVAEESADPPDEPSMKAQGVMKRRVLVVDDMRVTAHLLRQLLEALGQDVQVCHDGASALEVARRHRPEIVFSDIAMPHQDGYQLAAELRAEESLNGIILVAMTGHDEDGDRQRSHDAGFHHHLVKPVSLSTLKELLQR